MPGMNGLQLQSHLATAGCKIPVIFITAHDNKESRSQALQAGAVAFLGKPFSDELLLHAIRGALRQDGGGADDQVTKSRMDGVHHVVYLAFNLHRLTEKSV